MGEKEYQKIFSNNLKHYMNINNKSQIDLINDLGFNKSAVSTWVNGTRLPRMDKVNMLAEYFGCKRSDLIEDKSYTIKEGNFKYSKAITINVLGRVAAGIPINAIEEIIDTEEIPEDLARTGSFFGLLIKGDSMEPRICDGDVVIVRQQSDAENGDIVIAMVNGDDAVCKRLKKYAGGIALISLNSKYEPMMFSDKDISDKPVKILGKVIELRGKL